MKAERFCTLLEQTLVNLNSIDFLQIIAAVRQTSNTAFDVFAHQFTAVIGECILIIHDLYNKN